MRSILNMRSGVAAALVLGLSMAPVSVDSSSSPTTARINALCGASVGENCDMATDYICSVPPGPDYDDAVCVSGCGPGQEY
jgi:hypothetical protein